MRLDKLRALAGLAAVVALVAGACGAAPEVQTVEVTRVVEKEKEVQVTVEVEKEVVVTAEPIPGLSGTIRFATWDTAEGLDVLEEVVGSFKAAQPDVTVQLESVPDAYGEKLLTQFAAGDAPDVFQVGDGDVARFVQTGAIENLDAYINGDSPLDMGRFFPAVAAIGEVEGSTYLLTKDYSPLVLYFNKDLFDAAGVAYPEEGWTWDDFVAKAEALTLDTDGDGQTDQWGVQLPDHWGDPAWWRGTSPIVFSNGGDVLGPEGDTTTGFMNGPETVGAIEAYVDLFNRGIAPSKADIEALAGVDLFQSGRVAMLWTGRWPLGDFARNPQLDFGTMGLPALKDRANSICWAGFAMYSGSKNKEVAWEFLKHVGADEGAQALARYAFTPVQEIAELQGLDRDRFNAPIVADLQYIKPLPEFRSIFFGECVEKFYREAIERLLLEGGGVQTVMDAAAAKADVCLAEQT